MKKLKLKLLFVLILLSSLQTFAADTRAVDAIRKKDILANEDFTAIKSFVQSAVSDIVYLEDLTKSGSVRSVLVSRKSSISTVAKEQYEKAFNEAIIDLIPKAIDEAQTVDDGLKADSITVNLLILVNELANIEFVPLVSGYFTSSNNSQKYAALSCLVDKNVIEQFNASGSNAAVISKSVCEKLSNIINSDSNPAITSLIVDFAGQVIGSDATGLLLLIADKRIQEYRDWVVKEEIIDSKLLEYLGKRAKSAVSQDDKAILISRFAQLYSYAFQRYDKGSDILSDTQKGQLITVLVATEQGVLSDIMGSSLSNVKKAIEKRDNRALMTAHDFILGTKESKGALSEIINFDYGSNPDEPLTAPEELSEPSIK